MRRLLACTLTLGALAPLCAPAATFASPQAARSDPLDRRLQELGYLPSGKPSARASAEARAFALVAFQKQVGLPRTGSADRATRRLLLTGAARPRPLLAERGRRVEISLSRQLAYLVANGRVLRTIAVSTGAGGRTPIGSYRVFRKERMSWSVPFRVWLPYASYFHGGIAMHAYDPVPPYPASHGCVRVPPPFAAELYAFASIGTKVVVLP
jgi:hypothetical protein